MSPHLRIARPVRDLARAVDQYQRGLGLEQLARFVDHAGFDGAMLGVRSNRKCLAFNRPARWSGLAASCSGPSLLQAAGATR